MDGLPSIKIFRPLDLQIGRLNSQWMMMDPFMRYLYAAPWFHDVSFRRFG